MNNNFALSFAVTAFALVGFTFSVTESACFTEESTKNFCNEIDEVFKNFRVKCAEDNKANDDDAKKKCFENIVNTANRKCMENYKGSDQMPKCVFEKLGIPEITFEKYEEYVFGALVDESKKEEVKAALQPCKSDTGMILYICGVNKLSDGPCPEFRDLMTKILGKVSKSA